MRHVKGWDSESILCETQREKRTQCQNSWADANNETLIGIWKPSKNGGNYEVCVSLSDSRRRQTLPLMFDALLAARRDNGYAILE